MRLVSESITVTLPNDLFWKDEFEWTPTQKKADYSLAGSLILQTSLKLAGRPITLQPPDDSMAWLKRSTVELLYLWAKTPERVMTLTLEYPSDTRSFAVVFAPEESPVEAKPVKPFPGYEDDDWFLCTIKLLEI